MQKSRNLTTANVSFEASLCSYATGGEKFPGSDFSGFTC